MDRPIDPGCILIRDALYADSLTPAEAEHVGSCAECGRLARRLEQIDRINREALIPNADADLVDRILLLTTGWTAAGSEIDRGNGKDGCT